MRRSPARRRRRAAFTLMEVLLVVAILLILGSIVVVSFTGIFAGAEEDTAKTQLQQVAEAAKLFKFQCRREPTNIDELVTMPTDLDTSKWRGPYLPKAPLDPWQQEITLNPEGETFTVSSPGPPNQNKPIEIRERY
jgi:general secretion pathway protein G